MIPTIPNNGLPSQLYDVFKHAHYESRRRGDKSDMALAFMGGCLVFIGAQMILKGLGRGR